jgi:hypothetical protein
MPVTHEHERLCPRASECRGGIMSEQGLRKRPSMSGRAAWPITSAVRAPRFCSCTAIRVGRKNLPSTGSATIFRHACRGRVLPRRMELPGPTSDAVASDCITKLENAHGTEFGSFYIRGIRGLAFASAFTSRFQSRMALSFVVACTPACLRFRLGCSIDLPAPGYVLRLMRMSTLGHWRRSRRCCVLRHGMRRFQAHQNSPTIRIRERCMQLRIKQLQRRRRAPQMDLFAGEPHNAIGNMLPQVHG